VTPFSVFSLSSFLTLTGKWIWNYNLVFHHSIMLLVSPVSPPHPLPPSPVEHNLDFNKVNPLPLLLEYEQIKRSPNMMDITWGPEEHYQMHGYIVRYRCLASTALWRNVLVKFCGKCLLSCAFSRKLRVVMWFVDVLRCNFNCSLPGMKWGYSYIHVLQTTWKDRVVTFFKMISWHKSGENKKSSKILLE
jgi:hypothetical protein